MSVTSPIKSRKAKAANSKLKLKVVPNKNAEQKKAPGFAKGAKKMSGRKPEVSIEYGVMGIAPYHERPGEEYMNEKQREHFRVLLNHWKRQLMEEVDRTVHHMQDEAANFPDPNDRATQEEEFSFELRTRDRERKLIKKIEDALHKLDNDEYGYCEACGIEIGIRRLEARPTANLCIDCKTLDEIKEKQITA